MPEPQARARLHDTILCRNRLRRPAGCVATLADPEACPDGPMTDSHAAAAGTARNADTQGNGQGLRSVLARAHQAATRCPLGAR